MALRVLLLLVVILCLSQTRVWGFGVTPQPASGVFESVTPSSIGENYDCTAYDESDSLLAAKGMTQDQSALKQLVDEATMGGRKALPKDQAETVLDWARETKYPNVRAKPGDVASPSNWDANPVPHIHLPGAGRGGHVPVEPGVKPRH